MRLLLIVILAILLISLLPAWPYTAPWGLGYYPSGLLGVILLIVLIMALTGARRAPP